MTTPTPTRAALDAAIAAALPVSGGLVRKRLKQLRRALADVDEQRKPCARAGCRHARNWHIPGRWCAGDLMSCRCAEYLTEAQP